MTEHTLKYSNLKEIHLKIYATLSTRTKRALKRKYKRFKSGFKYNPRGNLLDRLSNQFNISKTQAYNYLMEINLYFLELYED